MTSTRTGLKWAAALAVSALLAGCATAEPVVTPSPIVTEEPEPEPEPEPVVAEPVVVFEGVYNATYPTGDFIGDDGTIEYEEVDGGLQISYNTNEAVAYFQRIGIANISDYTALEFDLTVVADPREDRTWFIKMDCGWPCGSEDFPIGELPAVGATQSYSIPLADLVANVAPNGTASTLDLAIVNTPLVLHSWGNMMGVVIVVNNVKVV